MWRPRWLPNPMCSTACCIQYDPAEAARTLDGVLPLAEWSHTWSHTWGKIEKICRCPSGVWIFLNASKLKCSAQLFCYLLIQKPIYSSFTRTSKKKSKFCLVFPWANCISAAVVGAHSILSTFSKSQQGLWRFQKCAGEVGSRRRSK